MALLQISEPGMSTAPHQHRLAVGIDLGTTNSLVASVRSGKAETLPDGEGRHLLPSVIHYTADKEPLVGCAACEMKCQDSANTLSSVKRLLGRGTEDMKLLAGSLPYIFSKTESAVPRISTAAGEVSAIEASAEILKVLKQRAVNTLGDELSGVVIAVPAYFDEAQRQATRDAAKLAGLNVFRMLNEPTAAAVAYGLDSKEEGVIAVYDLGGGTFDISILRLSKGVFEVLSTGGDSALGGDDIDHAIAEWVLEQASFDQYDDKDLLRQVLVSAREAKEHLSSNSETTITVGNWQGVLDEKTFKILVDPFVKKTLKACRRALRDAEIDKEDVIDIVMVGGSTRMPYVRQRVGEFFGRDPLVDIDPDRVVALGAAYQADILAGNKPDGEMLLLDVTPLSLGLEMMGGLVEKVVARNTSIPVARAQEFTTYKDGQTAMSIHILQGERDTVETNRSLGKFALRGIPPLPAGAARIKVTFQIDADGLLNVSAEELSTGIKSDIEIKPSYGLTDKEVETMLRESMENAQEDMETRRLREVQVEADRVVEALDSAMKMDGNSLLDETEKQRLLDGRKKLVEAKQSDKHDVVSNAIKDMEKVAEFYVERRMNASVKTAMSGHNVNEFE